MERGSIFDKKLLLVTGKGGIGKTLVTAALGQAAASSGLETLLVESTTLDQLPPLFGKGSAGHKVTALGPRLSCLNINARDNFREWMTKYLGQKILYETVFSNRVVESFINIIPGLAEVMLLGRLFYASELATPPRSDLIILDGFASGHFLSLMTTPDAILRANIGGPLASETRRVREFLSDQNKCGILYVTTPEELVVSETLDFLPKLHEVSPAPLQALVVNRALYLGSNVTDEDKGAAALYARQEQMMAHHAKAQLDAGLAALREQGLTLPMLELPDLGFIDESLPEHLAKLLLQEIEGLKAVGS